MTDLDLRMIVNDVYDWFMVESLRQYLSEWLTLTVEDAADLARFVTPCDFPSGATLVRQGDHPCVDAILLQQGFVRTYYLSGGKEINLRLLTAPAAALPYNRTALGFVEAR